MRRTPGADYSDAEVNVSLDKLPPLERKLLDWAKRKKGWQDSLGVLLEGEKIILEALAAGLKMETAWAVEPKDPKDARLIEKIRRAGCPVSIVKENLLTQISELETPPGIVVAAHQPVFKLARPSDRWRLIVALFGAQDPGNVGGVIRTAEYFGVDEVWLNPNSADPYAPKALRGSMGAFLRMPIFRGELAPRIERFKVDGAIVWAAVAHGERDSQIEPAPRRILLIGSESKGLNEKETLLAHKRIMIERKGRSESLNLAVATGILIHSATQDERNSAKSKHETGR